MALTQAYPYKSPIAQFHGESGDLLSGGKVYTYMAGTNTPLITYITADKAVANPNIADLIHYCRFHIRSIKQRSS